MDASWCSGFQEGGGGGGEKEERGGEEVAEAVASSSIAGHVRRPSSSVSSCSTHPVTLGTLSHSNRAKPSQTDQVSDVGSHDSHSVD